MIGGNFWRVGIAVLIIGGVVSCGKNEAPAQPDKPALANKPATVTQPPVSGAILHKRSDPVDPNMDPALAAIYLSEQMDRTEAVRCGAVFAAVRKNSGQSEQVTKVRLFSQATKYLTELPVPGSKEPPPTYPEIQAAVDRESQIWTKGQRAANLNYCFNHFQTLYSLLSASGKIKNK